MSNADIVKVTESATCGAGMNAKFGEAIVLARAHGLIQHRNAAGELLHEEETWNLVTNAGRDFIHAQAYSTSPGGNGLNYIALSNDTVTETTSSTTLSTEIAANGLTRAIGAYAHTASTNTTTISKTFTCTTTSQAAQKAALFTAASVGTMNHVLAFTQRTLQVGDTLAITFTITLG